MGTYDITIHTAACDVETCDEVFGDYDDFSCGWAEFSRECEAFALRGGWTKNVNGLLICEALDEDHDEARDAELDTRPKPGPGQLVLVLT
ncbi:hypothetical protein [Kitasatospora sp. NPDC005856]|uniref:hypothetical protein n=1 Tax=Kitasatospora sp. NPDC005856 TaxID=3154566 RepID=UPI0033DD75E0